MRVADVRRVMEPELLQLEGVVGVSHSNPHEVIYIYVENREQVSYMPRYLDGVPVITRPIGKLEIVLSRTERVRPLIGGISAGHPSITAGTLGVLTNDGKLLSNNHVFAASNKGRIGDAILQPAPYDGGRAYDKVATLERFIRIEEDNNLVDAAIASPTVDAKKEILDEGVVSGWTDAYAGQVIEKSGRTTGHTYTHVFDTNATVKIGGYPFGTAIFKDQILFDNVLGALKGGDSGSLAITELFGLKLAVGLCFAASPVAGVANKIGNVIDALHIDLGTYIPAPSVPSPATLIPGTIPILLPAGIMALQEGEKWKSY